MKKIIFIGGTARSGSTLLDLIISNDAKAMSLGEVHALFHPTRKHHFEEISKLRASEIWNPILEGGKKNLFPNLIKYFPEVDVFVDSSKDPFWFVYHQKLHRGNFKIKNVLIHKTPSELANSFIKRGMNTEWKRTYISYHLRYFSLIDDFVSISYKNLVKKESHLRKLCEVLDMCYFEKKIGYWEKEQITFFGSNSVKSYTGHVAKGQLTNQERTDIKYDGVQKEYINYIQENIENNSVISLIEEEIKRSDIFSNMENQEITKVGYNRGYLYLFSIKRSFKHKYYYYFPQNIFKK